MTNGIETDTFEPNFHIIVLTSVTGRVSQRGGSLARGWGRGTANNSTVIVKPLEEENNGGRESCQCARKKCLGWIRDGCCPGIEGSTNTCQEKTSACLKSLWGEATYHPAFLYLYDLKRSFSKFLLEKGKRKIRFRLDFERYSWERERSIDTSD